MLKLATASFAALMLTIIMLANTSSLRPILRWLNQVPAFDKFVHFGFMGTLATLLSLCLERRGVRIGRFHIPAGVLIVAAFSTLEEMSQMFIETRSFSLRDMTANLLGAALGGVVAALILRRRG